MSEVTRNQLKKDREEWDELEIHQEMGESAEYFVPYLFDIIDSLFADTQRRIDEAVAAEREHANDECWAVCYSNYYPTEVDSLWATKELADRHADSLNDKPVITSWNVRRWEIKSRANPEDKGDIS